MSKELESERKLAAIMASNIAGHIMSATYYGGDDHVAERSVRMAIEILEEVDAHVVDND